MKLSRVLLLVAFLGASLGTGLGVVACGGSSPESATSPKGDKSDADDEEEVSSKGKKWGGWRWKGKRNDCFFLYKNECFSTLKKACRRAKCGDACEHDDSAPAKVSCKGDEAKSKKKD